MAGGPAAATVGVRSRPSMKYATATAATATTAPMPMPTHSPVRPPPRPTSGFTGGLVTLAGRLVAIGGCGWGAGPTGRSAPATRAMPSQTWAKFGSLRSPVQCVRSVACIILKIEGGTTPSMVIGIRHLRSRASWASALTQSDSTERLVHTTTTHLAALSWASITWSQDSPAPMRVSHQIVQPLACRASTIGRTFSRSSRL